jgi:hypothetical protein
LLALLIIILDKQSSLPWLMVPPMSICRLGFWFSESVLFKFMALLLPDRGSGRCGRVFGEAKEGCLFMGDNGVRP